MECLDKVFTIRDLAEDLECSLDAAIAVLTEEKEEAEAAGYRDLKLRIGTTGGWDDVDRAEIALVGTRKETEAEATTRIARQTARKSEGEARERAELARLQAKYA